jgi:hypothetical protein
MTRKASGTWSSDSEDVMSVAAECFCKPKNTGETKLEAGAWQLLPYTMGGPGQLTPKAQKPKMMMTKSTTSARNMSA